MYALDFITRAMRTLGVLSEIGTPNAQQARDGFDALNAMIDDWKSQRLTMEYTVRTVEALTANFAAYTIGTGGEINISRPLLIIRAGLILDNTVATQYQVEVPISVYTDQEWANTQMKELRSTLPQGVYYEKSWSAGLGQIRVFPVPSTNTTSLVLYTPSELSEFADLSTTDYTFSPSYERAIWYNLAIEIADQYGVDPSANTQSKAIKSLANVKRRNITPEEMTIDPAVTGHGGGYWDYQSNQYRSRR